MTRKEAICKVEGYLTDIIPSENYSEVEEIMKALEQQPCDDAIGRAEAISRIEVRRKITCESDPYNYEEWTKGYEEGIDDAIAMINSVPSVTPQQKIGRWEYVQYDNNPNIGNWHCLECRGICTEMHSIEDAYNYCPRCGAKMEVEE